MLPSEQARAPGAATVPRPVELSHLISLVLVFAALCAYALIVVYSLRTGISPMPSTARARARVLQAIPHATAGSIYELGSGWGTLAFALADHFPRCQVIGCELSPLPYLVSRLRQRWSPRTNLVLRREDLLKLSLTPAAAVVCYLCPPVMQELGRKLVTECRPNTLVVSNTFSIHSWTADQVHMLGDLYDSRVYVYRVPAVRPRMSASTVR